MSKSRELLDDNFIPPKKKALSLKEIVSHEYKKCAVDPVYFMRKYCKIQHPMRGKILFNLYPFQEDLLTDLNDHKFNIILKARQLGISTISAAYGLWKMTFVSDFNVLVIATNQDVAKNLVTKVRVMYDNLPTWMRAEYDEHNKLSLRFRNGSHIKAASANAEAGRSEALSLLIIDEAAFISNAHQIWTAAQPTLSSGGSAILLSTPNGTGNFFHQKWVEAETKGTMNTITLPWQVHPEREQPWRDAQTALVGEKQAAQENDCDFISSGHTLIDGAVLQWYKDTHQEEPAAKEGVDGNLWIWRYPDYSKSYIVTCDVARGDGQDWSACHVIDVETTEQVAEYEGKIGTTDYGHFLVSLATRYNHALLSIENANIGWATIQVVLDAHYSNLYYSIKTPNYIDENLHVAKQYDLMDKSQLVPGFTMSTRTRPLVISKLETYFRERTPLIHSSRLINQLFVFIWNGRKAEAQSGYNDDLVISFGQGLFIRDTALKLRQQGIDLTRRSINSIHRPIHSSNGAVKHPAWDIKIGKHNENLRWLL